MLNSKFRFCLNPQLSPTAYNLSRYLQEYGWIPTRFNRLAHFSEQHLQFDTHAAEQLEFKHLLAELVAAHCPETMPITYCVNDYNWQFVVDQIIHNHYKDQDSHTQLVWILKPALLNNGKNIKIFRTISEIKAHFINPRRLGGEHVLQHYISPHLLREHHKYSIRLFVIATNYAGSYLYPQGYFNVALHPFDPNNFTDLRSHLTNEHLQDDETNVVQIPTQRFTAFDSLYPKIKAIVTTVFQGLQQRHPHAFSCKKQRALAIFGVDFMVDNHEQVWLLEANHGPCFPIQNEHPLQTHLYKEFWHAFIASFVIPIAVQSPPEAIQYHLFEKVLN